MTPAYAREEENVFQRMFAIVQAPLEDHCKCNPKYSGNEGEKQRLIVLYSNAYILS